MHSFFMSNGLPRARLDANYFEGASNELNFVPSAGRLWRVSDCAQVDDGWLVGFNHGEFGAALYWFSKDGNRVSWGFMGSNFMGFHGVKSSICTIERWLFSLGVESRQL
jgi:hypothetical protein